MKMMPGIDQEQSDICFQRGFLLNLKLQETTCSSYLSLETFTRRHAPTISELYPIFKKTIILFFVTRLG